MLFIGMIITGVFSVLNIFAYFSNLLPYLWVEVFNHAGGYQLGFYEYAIKGLLWLIGCTICYVLLVKAMNKARTIENEKTTRICKLERKTYIYGLLYFKKVSSFEVYVYTYIDEKDGSWKVSWVRCSDTKVLKETTNEPRIEVKTIRRIPLSCFLTFEVETTERKSVLHVPEDWL